MSDGEFGRKQLTGRRQGKGISKVLRLLYRVVEARDTKRHAVSFSNFQLENNAKCHIFTLGASENRRGYWKLWVWRFLEVTKIGKARELVSESTVWEGTSRYDMISTADALFVCRTFNRIGTWTQNKLWTCSIRNKAQILKVVLKHASLGKGIRNCGRAGKQQGLENFPVRITRIHNALGLAARLGIRIARGCFARKPPFLSPFSTQYWHHLFEVDRTEV